MGKKPKRKNFSFQIFLPDEIMPFTAFKLLEIPTLHAGISILGGLPKAGKTHFFAWLSAQAVKQGKPVVFHTTETLHSYFDKLLRAYLEKEKIQLATYKEKFFYLEFAKPYPYSQLLPELRKKIQKPFLLLVENLRDALEEVSKLPARNYDSLNPVLRKLNSIALENQVCVFTAHHMGEKAREKLAQEWQQILNSTAIASAVTAVYLLEEVSLLNQKFKVLKYAIGRFSPEVKTPILYFSGKIKKI